MVISICGQLRANGRGPLEASEIAMHKSEREVNGDVRGRESTGRMRSPRPTPALGLDCRSLNSTTARRFVNIRYIRTQRKPYHLTANFSECLEKKKILSLSDQENKKGTLKFFFLKAIFMIFIGL